MRTLDAWLAAYGESHRNPANETIHRIVVPIIYLDVLGLLRAIPLGGSLDGAAIGAALVLLYYLYYLRLSPALAAGMAVFTGAGLAALAALHAVLGGWYVAALAGVFVVAWIAQFVGHGIEGRKPSFTQDVQFFLIGPLWVLADVYRRCGGQPSVASPLSRRTTGPAKSA
ncbi:MAG: DUF962 domain-containing protein [bacterium]|nr:DUF962 domain-containing protein [bacterium]